MQVVVDGRYFCSLHRSLAIFTGNLLRALVRLNPEARPVVLVPGDLHEISVGIREDLGETVRWVRPPQSIDRIGRLGPELRWVHREMPRLLRREVPDADLLVMPYHHPPFRTPGVVRAVVLHDLCGLGEGFPKTKKNFWRHYLRLRAAAHSADVIWPISQATRDHMARRFRASRSRLGPVVYNGVDRAPVADDALDGVLSHYGLERNRYVLVYATWQERKNFTASLLALALLKRRGRPVRLVGIAPEGEVDDMFERCRSEGLTDALILGGLSDAEVDALYAGALALIWPSTCEGFGYPIVEAMTQGCPPLVWATGPGSELVHGAVEPLPTLAAEVIADRIDALRTLDTKDRIHLEERLRDRAGNFSMEQYRRQLQAAMLSLNVRT